MGTGFEVGVCEEEQGIISRAVKQLFQGIEQRCAHAHETHTPPPQFKVSAQFLEVSTPFQPGDQDPQILRWFVRE